MRVCVCPTAFKEVLEAACNPSLHTTFDFYMIKRHHPRPNRLRKSAQDEFDDEQCYLSLAAISDSVPKNPPNRTRLQLIQVFQTPLEKMLTA